MSRLLFAAARGARVQRQKTAIHGVRTWWECVDIQWGLDDELRIHPDDDHLQYGPISSALRDMAEAPQQLMEHFDAVSRHYINCRKYSDELYMHADELHRSLFLLFLAEALADEGL